MIEKATEFGRAAGGSAARSFVESGLKHYRIERDHAQRKLKSKDARQRRAGQVMLEDLRGRQRAGLLAAAKRFNEGAAVVGYAEIDVSDI